LNKQHSEHLAELMLEIMPKTVQYLREEMRKGRGERLTVPQFRVLAAISRGLCSNKELGDLLGVSEAAVSRMLDFLVNEGLVKKAVNKNDRRQTSLSLTAEGQKLHKIIKTDARTRISEKLSSLPESEALAIIHGLDLLQKNLSLLADHT